MDEDLVEAAHAYASRHALEVRERLGSGIHGIVHVVESKTEPGRRALKLHRDSDSYLREKKVYERLSEKRVSKILGFQVPVPLRFDDELMAIEMTIVMPPFVLDFAGASLDAPMEFFRRNLGRLGKHKAGTIRLTMGNGSGDLERTASARYIHARSFT